MADPSGKLSHIGMKLEKVFGTPDGSASDFIKFNSESLTLGIEEIIEASMQARRDEPDSYEGLGTVAGDTVHDVHPVGIGYLLRSWFGQPVTTERTYFAVVTANKFLDFNIGAGELVATLTEGVYAAGLTHADDGSLCKELYDQIVASENAGTYTVAYSRSTRKFTITRSAGTFELMWATGTHGSAGTDDHIGTLLGYSDAADDDSALTYTSDTAVESAYQHVFTPSVHIVPSTRRGTATAGGATTLTDSGQSWSVDQQKGWWVHIVEGTGAGQYRAVTDNDATSVTVDTWTTNPSTDSVYEIIPGPENCITPPYTLEVHRDLPVSTSAFQFKGMVANTLALSFGVGAKILTGTIGWLGKDVIPLAKTSPSMPSTEPFKWSDAKIGIGTFDSGTATGGAAATIIDSAGGWTVDDLIEKLILKGNAAGTKHEIRPITDNDGTTITVSPAWVDAAIATDTYEIFYCPDIAETLEFTLDGGLVAFPMLNYTKRINRIVGDAYRMGASTLTVIPQNITDFNTYFKGWTTRRWIVWFHGQVISGSNYHELAFLFPNVLMTAYPINIPGGGRITVAIAAKFKYDTTATYLTKCWLYNDKPNYGW